MERILQSNIFFFITSIAVVTVAVVLVMVLFQLFKVLRSVRNISEQVEEEVSEARSDLGTLREKIAMIPGLGFLSRPQAKTTRRKTKKAK